MKKIKPLIKIFSCISSILFCALSYSNNNIKKNCYAQFFNQKTSSIKLPENMQERQVLLQEINSNLNEYSDYLNLPKNQKIRKKFFYFVGEAMAIPFAERVYPKLRLQKSKLENKTVMDTVHITFKRPN